MVRAVAGGLVPLEDVEAVRRRLGSARQRAAIMTALAAPAQRMRPDTDRPDTGGSGDGDRG